MDITDTATGSLWIKRPGMMRWEYEQPEKQLIVTDRMTLWVYRPADQQVMVGDAQSYFGDGKGASFLSDLGVIRKKFNLSKAPAADDQHYVVKLVPLEEQFDLAAIYLTVSKTAFDVIRVTTYNAYGDETRIELSQFDFAVDPDDVFFQFQIPDGVDVLQLEP
jgi:outer membrane lipoprotein carrier protein